MLIPKSLWKSEKVAEYLWNICNLNNFGKVPTWGSSFIYWKILCFGASCFSSRDNYCQTCCGVTSLYQQTWIINTIMVVVMVDVHYTRTHYNAMVGIAIFTTLGKLIVIYGITAKYSSGCCSSRRVMSVFSTSTGKTSEKVIKGFIIRLEQVTAF